jgi:hypothetical protein
MPIYFGGSRYGCGLLLAACLLAACRKDAPAAPGPVVLPTTSTPAPPQYGTPTAFSTVNVCAFTKTAGAEQALVLANVRNTAATYPVPAALAGTTWTNALTGAATTLDIAVLLPGYGS